MQKYFLIEMQKIEFSTTVSMFLLLNKQIQQIKQIKLAIRRMYCSFEN